METLNFVSISSGKWKWKNRNVTLQMGPYIVWNRSNNLRTEKTSFLSTHVHNALTLMKCFSFRSFRVCAMRHSPSKWKTMLSIDPSCWTWGEMSWKMAGDICFVLCKLLWFDRSVANSGSVTLCVCSLNTVPFDIQNTIFGRAHFSPSIMHYLLPPSVRSVFCAVTPRCTTKMVYRCQDFYTTSMRFHMLV